MHQRIDRNRVFGGLRSDLPGQFFFDNHQIALPVHAAMNDDDVGNIVETISNGW